MKIVFGIIIAVVIGSSVKADPFVLNGSGIGPVVDPLTWTCKGDRNGKSVCERRGFEEKRVVKTRHRR